MLESQFQVVPFNRSYLDNVVEINRICLPENYSSYFFINLHERFPKTFHVALVNEKVVGYIMCRIEVGLSELGKLSLAKKGHIVSLAVLPEYRGMRIASALVKEALKGMTEYKVNESFLEVRASNHSAINLYKKFDFIPRRTIPSYYRDGENGLVLSKKF